MRLMILLSTLLLAANTAAAYEPMADYARRVREDFEAEKNVQKGAFSPDPVKQVKQPVKEAVQPKQPEIKQPVKEIAKPKQPEVNHPVKKVAKPQQPEIKQPVKEIAKPKLPEKHHVEVPNPHHNHVEHRPVKPHTTTRVVTTVPAVSYTIAGSGVVYEANPHIYAVNSYFCGTKNDLKYCTDSAGKALTGRIVQNYTDSVAYETYRNGYLSGETSVYLPDGTLLQTTEYSKGLKHGKEKVYFGNGRLHYVANYSRGSLNGEIRQYDMAGTLIGEMRYSKGKYTYRYCRYDTRNDLLNARIRANEKNVLILCADN